jgi:hypothetical protein
MVYGILKFIYESKNKLRGRLVYIYTAVDSMAHGIKRVFSSRLKPIYVFFIIAILLTYSTTAQTNEDPLRKYISHPGNIPEFHDFETPSIIPGNSGELKFKIKNRYTDNDDNTLDQNYTMKSVTLRVNVYHYSTLEENKEIKKISNSPKIVSGSSALKTIIDRSTVDFYWSQIGYNETVNVIIKFKTSSDTPEGRYFVRMHLNFSFQDSYFDMKSRGHFTDDDWESASMDITDEEGYTKVGNEIHLIYGRLDLDKLEVGLDGIIPETSIRVLTPIPTWPLYFFLIPLAAFFLILAVVFYYMDEKGKFPKTKKKLDDIGQKIEDIRYRRR